MTPTTRITPSDAKGILKAELKRRGMTYADLVAALAEHGVAETEANLRNKLSRGSFTASFFLQCLVAIGCERVQIPLSGPAKAALTGAAPAEAESTAEGDDGRTAPPPRPRTVAQAEG